MPMQLPFDQTAGDPSAFCREHFFEWTRPGSELVRNSARAARRAVAETAPASALFPAEGPFNIGRILDTEFLP